MTSNIGSDRILAAEKITDTVKLEIQELLHQTFRPEFLNRIDEILFFESLSTENITAITQLQIDKIQKRLQEKELALTITKEALAYIAAQGYEKEFGARPLARAINRLLVNPLALEILKKPKSKQYMISLEEDHLVIKTGDENS